MTLISTTKYGPQPGYYWYNDLMTLYPIPKNASTHISLITGLRAYSNYEKDRAADTKYRVAVLRNPYTRIVSSYSEVIKLRIDGPHNITRNLPFHNIKEPIERFNQFLEDITNNLYDGHLRPQSECLYGVPTDGMTFMNFDNVVEQFKQILSIDLGTSKSRVMDPTFSTLHDYISTSQAIRDKVYSIYSNDFDYIKDHIGINYR